jgi:hypothetical protein
MQLAYPFCHHKSLETHSLGGFQQILRMEQFSRIQAVFPRRLQFINNPNIKMWIVNHSVNYVMKITRRNVKRPFMRHSKIS